MDKLKTVLNIANQQSGFGFGLVALLTAAGEQVFSSVVFSCPCNGQNFLYGMVFLLVPALALLLLGYILSKRTWKLFTGLCGGARPWRWKKLLTCGAVLLQISATALVAPCSWIAVALLNGRYFECVMTGANVSAFVKPLCGDTRQRSRCETELHMFPCRRGSDPQDVDGVLVVLRAQSQILGWMLIALLMLSSLLLTCLARCSSPISHNQLEFWRAYAREESDLLDSRTVKHAKELAERNLRSFFEQTPPDSLVTPSNRDWMQISSLYRFSTQDQYYSTLHRYVESWQEMESNTMRMASLKSQSPIDNPAVLSFVDDGRMVL